MPKNKDAYNEERKQEYRYWRVIVTYNDGETSGNRVFKGREKAEEWAARQKKSPVVKKAVLEPFVRQQNGERPTSKHHKTGLTHSSSVIAGLILHCYRRL